MSKFAALSKEEIEAGSRPGVGTGEDKASRVIMPIPPDAPPAPATHPYLGAHTGEWTYCDGQGRILFVVRRFDPVGGRKQFYPLTLWSDGRGNLNWGWKCIPPLRPLYGLHELTGKPDAHVIVVEGEKCADAALQIFPDAVIVTSPNGSGAADKADWTPITDRDVMIWADADEPGAKYAAAVADILLTHGCDVSVVDVAALAALAPDGSKREVKPGWDCADAVGEWSDLSALRDAVYDFTKPLDAATKPAGEAPRPLRREPSPAEPFPIDALGGVLGGAASAIVDKIQCPDAIAAASVLAAASLAVQSHADVLLPAIGAARPLSLFVATVAASGERKSAADTEALRPIRQREDKLREQHERELPSYRIDKRAYDVAAQKAEKTARGRDAIEAALRELGPEPVAPLSPILTCEEPTLEGLHKLYAIGQPSLGLFSDEGGSFISGHAMSDDARLRTVAGLSSLWDGKPIRRIRGGDGSSVLPGRRLAVHLMAQPDAAARMLSDSVLMDQGFLSRVLVSSPVSTVGTRFQKPTKIESETALRRYRARLLDILETQPKMLAGARNALEPRELTLDDSAKSRWLAFADYVEGRLGAGGALEPIKGFANKLPEHAARIAGVLTLVENVRAGAIDVETLDRAITIADFFTTEALRLFEAGACSPELRDAEKLLGWLHSAWHEPLIGLRVIYRLGPNSIREAAAAKRAVAILEDHGWLIQVEGNGHVVAGEPVREAWRIVRGE
jgi:hypothetical protein